MKIFEWMIEDIIAAHPDLYLEHCVVMAAALTSLKSGSPYDLTVTCRDLSLPALGCEESFLLRVFWTGRTAAKVQRVWQTEQRRSSSMRRTKVKLSESELDKMLGEASWLLSHAQALADYGREKEAVAEITRAANCEEQVAYWLDVARREQEAVIHRISAASCYEQLGQYARAVTLLRAALSRSLSDDYRSNIERQLTRCLAKAHKPLRRASSHAARVQAVTG